MKVLKRNKRNNACGTGYNNYCANNTSNSKR